jgi:carbonic anhydrase/acetyltransferase-like protein (isoleucine patch superfamily)
MTDLNTILTSVLDESELLRIISGIRSSYNEDITARGFRNLTPEETDQLIKQNNHAEDWNTVYVTENFLTSFISDSRFYGKCFLGRFTGFLLEVENGVLLPSGIYNTTIKGSAIGDECLICRCGIAANYIISPNTVIYNSGSITAGRNNLFGNGREIAVGPETGERSLKIFAGLNLNIAELILNNDQEPTYAGFISSYINRCTMDCGYIGKNCRIINTSSIRNSFISDDTEISGTSLISDSTILSSANEKTFTGPGACISSTLLQWGCSVDTMSVITGSLLMEHTHTEKSCIITDSIIGPNSSIGEAEITSCFAGPFTAAHHHSLLIACIWPGGRGNIGYGANVGSNHTSRLPDQEIFPGEGMFFGLGTSIKFPADYSRSPYSVISTGAVTLPQKVEFPFSLITQPSMVHPGINLTYNELIPAWVLSENIYSVIRNESKYRLRNRSHRNEIDFTIFRPDTIDLMINARSRLMSISHGKDLYTEQDIPGSGKNFITEINRARAINTYTFHIQFYALRLLAHRIGKILSENKGIESSVIYDDDPDIRYWSHGKSVIKNEGLADIPLKENLEKLVSHNEIFLSAVYSSKEKDFIKGVKIVHDYGRYHESADADRFITELKNKTVIEHTRIEQLLKML